MEVIGDIYSSSSSGAPKLRIGILIEDFVLSAVDATILSQIEACTFAEIVLVVRDGRAGGGAPVGARVPPGGKVSAAAPPARPFSAYGLYLKLDERRCYDERLDPLKPVDCEDKFAGIDEIAVRTEQAGRGQRFPKGAVEAIRACRVDVLVKFGFGRLEGDILTAARCGVWSFRYADPEYYRGGPAYFWEMVEKRPVCGAVLEILGEKPGDRLVLAKGQYATEADFSLFRNRIGPYWGSAHFLVWKLKELHELGFETLKARAARPAPYRGRRAVYGEPGTLEMLRWFGGTMLRKFRRKSEPRMLHWQTALRTGASVPSIRPGAGKADLSGFRFITAPKGHFYADPFLFEKNGRTYLFLEDYSYAETRGDLVVMDVTDEVPAVADLCLKTGSHLSYPFVFAHEGGIYMIPETMAAGEVALYRAEEFPHRWVKERVLYTGSIVDTTLWIENGVYYFFATFIFPGTEAVSLHLFTAESLTGEWRHHPASPISNDVRDARGAGRLFRQDGVLYRPAQDCSGTYGRAIRCFRVDELTPDRYSETLVLEVEPSAVPPFQGMPAEGTHTYDRCGRFEVIDAKFNLPLASL